MLKICILSFIDFLRRIGMRLSFTSLISIILIIISPLHAQQTSKRNLLTMEEAISRALSRNNRVRATEFAVKKANWDKKHAWTLLFPTVSVNSRYSWIDDSTYALRDFSKYFEDMPEIPGMDIDIPQVVFQKSYYTSLDVTMPLFNSALLNSISIANVSEDMAIQFNKSTRNNVAFMVISTYLFVLKNKEILKLQQDYLELSGLNYEKAERMHDAGRYSKTEALRWKVDLQQQKSVVVNSESALRSTMTIFTRLLNMDMREYIEIENRIPQSLLTESQKLEQFTDEEILALVQLDDNELIQANAALAAAKSNEKISKKLYHNSYTSYLPNLSLSYSYGWRENNTVELDDYSPQTLMVNLSMPLFTGFKNVTSTKAAYYDYKRSYEDFYDQMQNIRLILTETVNKIINLKTQRQLAATNVEFTEKNYSIVEQQKEKGLVSNIDFIDAKLNWQNAKLNDISAHYDFITAMVELYYLLGKLDKVIEY